MAACTLDDGSSGPYVGATTYKVKGNKGVMYKVINPIADASAPCKLHPPKPIDQRHCGLSCVGIGSKQIAP